MCVCGRRERAAFSQRVQNSMEDRATSSPSLHNWLSCWFANPARVLAVVSCLGWEMGWGREVQLWRRNLSPGNSRVLSGEKGVLIPTPTSFGGGVDVYLRLYLKFHAMHVSLEIYIGAVYDVNLAPDAIAIFFENIINIKRTIFGYFRQPARPPQPICLCIFFKNLLYLGWRAITKLDVLLMRRRDHQ